MTGCSSSATTRGYRQAIGVTRISTIPTLAERQGIFTGVSKIYDPATTLFNGGAYTRTEFPGDVITAPLDPAAVRAAVAHFLRRHRGGRRTTTRARERCGPQNQFDVRVDGAHGHERSRVRALLVLQRGGAAGDAAAGWERADFGVGARHVQCTRAYPMCWASRRSSTRRTPLRRIC